MSAKLISAVIAVFGLNQVYGHSGDRVYPFYQITDEAAIDITDGTIEDWAEFGEPSLTSLDFTGFTSYQGNGESMEVQPVRSRLPYLSGMGTALPTASMWAPSASTTCT